MTAPSRRTVYRGTCRPGAPDGHRVVAIDADTREEEVLAPARRPGATLHSPTGYGWGYLGSGPAQLAQDLLRHRTGREPSPALYQRFKAGVVALWRIDAGWVMPGHAIDRWLDTHAGDDDWLDRDRDYADLPF